MENFRHKGTKALNPTKGHIKLAGKYFQKFHHAEKRILISVLEQTCYLYGDHIDEEDQQ